MVTPIPPEFFLSLLACFFSLGVIAGCFLISLLLCWILLMMDLLNGWARVHVHKNGSIRWLLPGQTRRGCSPRSTIPMAKYSISRPPCVTRTGRPIPASGCHQRHHHAPDIGVRQFVACYGSSGGHRIIHVAGIRCCPIPEHAGGMTAGDWLGGAAPKHDSCLVFR